MTRYWMRFDSCQNYARQFNFDLDAICEYSPRKQQLSGVPAVSFPKKPVRRTALGGTATTRSCEKTTS